MIRYTFKPLRELLFVLFFVVAFYWVHCDQAPEQLPEDQILVRIDDRVITVDDFKRRAEYTIRPPYCNNDNYIHRKIILNSLIAEKLFAMETRPDNELLNTEQFQEYLQGRQEQSMRQWLFYKDFYNTVKLDTANIRKTYKRAGREYTIDYVSFTDSSIAVDITSHFQSGASFDKVFASVEEIPQRKVTWGSKENRMIHDALYSDLLEKGSVVGPLALEKNSYIVLRIAGYSDVRHLTDTDIQNRIREIKDRMKMDSAIGAYTQFVKSVMTEKQIDFNRETFVKLVNLIGPLYMTDSKEKEAAFKSQIWDTEGDDINLDGIVDDIDKIADEPLLKIEDEVWTVKRFKKELNIHPLVFRKKRIKKSEFAEQFKYAIADMIRDKYIANEARKKGYDQSIAVELNLQLWRDYLLGLYNRNAFLAETGRLAGFHDQYLTVLENDLDPYVRELQQKYSEKIQINTDLFEQIQLSRIDMMALQDNVPYPVVVPHFPIMTTHDKLDYGNRIDTDINKTETTANM